MVGRIPFKVGERVRCTKSDGYSKKDATGVIIKTNIDDPLHPRVKWDGADQGTWWCRYIVRIRARDLKRKAEASKPNPELGAKYDSGKLLFGCLTGGLAKPLQVLAAVLTYGAIKYERDSWQSVPNGKERYLDAADRHFNAYRAGEATDEESGLHHLAHTAINVLFALHFEMQENPLLDYLTFKQPMAKEE